MASQDPARPNIVFILSDDQGAWALGCDGNDEIITPHLDAMAAEGVRLPNSFCVSPVCSPSRASLLTGRIPSAHGVQDWIAAGHIGPGRVDYLAGQTLLTDLLADAGYRCGLVGKWHLGASDVPRPGFVRWFAHASAKGPYYGAPMVRDGQVSMVEGYLTDMLTDEACGFVEDESAGSEPFFLALNFTAPHRPWAGNHPAALTDLYKECAFDSCPQGEPHAWLPLVDGVPLAGERDTRAALVGYFAAVTGLDAGVGRVVETLRRLGLDRSTLVFFSSDNGFNCGQHGIWGKGNGTFPQNMYDTSVKVPAIFWQPGRVPGGRVSPVLCSGYDVLPTLLDHVGLARDDDPSLPGRSFARLLGGAADGADREHVVVYDEYGPVRMVRTREWKYVHRFPDGPHELYDLANDPGEDRNLAGEPGRAVVVAELRARLDDWFARYVRPRRDGPTLSVTGRGQRAPIGERHAFIQHDPSRPGMQR